MKKEKFTTIFIEIVKKGKYSKDDKNVFFFQHGT